MTVAELIELLSQQPPDVPVWLEVWDENGSAEATTVEVQSRGAMVVISDREVR